MTLHLLALLLAVCALSLSATAAAVPAALANAPSSTSSDYTDKHAGKRPQLSLTAGSIKIAVFSDLHYGENEDSFGPPQDVNSTSLMEYVLEVERPDFVILNGDLITGENTFRENSTRYVDRIVAPLVSRGIPWASTYGNHDTAVNLSRTGMLEEEQKYVLSLTGSAPPAPLHVPGPALVPGRDGVTNYLLPVKAAANDEPGAKPAFLLWFFDSRGAIGVDFPGFVTPDAVAWFRRASKAARRQWGDLPSFAFVHIPPYAFADLADDGTVGTAVYPGLDADEPLAYQGTSPTDKEPRRLMRALLRTPGLHSLYSGHDHGDNWCGEWPVSALPREPSNGPRPGARPYLCFGKHSGFGGYGSWNRGVRVLQVSAGGGGGGELAVETWQRLETGAVVAHVALNATYGRDLYPTDTGGYHDY